MISVIVYLWMNDTGCCTQFYKIRWFTTKTQKTWMICNEPLFICARPNEIHIVNVITTIRTVISRIKNGLCFSTGKNLMITRIFNKSKQQTGTTEPKPNIWKNEQKQKKNGSFDSIYYYEYEEGTEERKKCQITMSFLRYNKHSICFISLWLLYQCVMWIIIFKERR